MGRFNQYRSQGAIGGPDQARIGYERPSFVKKERIIRASVNLPFVYPSIGVSLAPVGCFEVALAAPSVNEPKAQ
jgi:hypothetical protein